MADKLWEGQPGGDLYEREGEGWDSGTGEWDISIGGGGGGCRDIPG